MGPEVFDCVRIFKKKLMLNTNDKNKSVLQGNSKQLPERCPWYNAASFFTYVSVEY